MRDPEETYGYYIMRAVMRGYIDDARYWAARLAVERDAVLTDAERAARWE